MSARTSAAVVVAVLAAALLGGCAGFGGTTSEAGGPRTLRPFEIVQGSFDKLRAAGTAHVRSQSHTQVGQEPVDVTGEGSADLARPAYDLTLTVPVFGSARAIGIVNLAYVRADRLSQFLGGNTNWLLIDPQRFGDPNSPGGSIDDPFVRFAESTGDALPQLALVKGARPDTRVVGPDTVDGQPVTHYTAQLDVETAKRYTMDPKISADLDRYTRVVRAAALPAEIWIDGQGRLVKLSLTFSQIFGKRGTDSTLSFSQLGAPIGPIDAPPPNQVTDLSTITPGG